MVGYLAQVREREGIIRAGAKMINYFPVSIPSRPGICQSIKTIS